MWRNTNNILIHICSHNIDITNNNTNRNVVNMKIIITTILITIIVIIKNMINKHI